MIPVWDAWWWAAHEFGRMVRLMVNNQEDAVTDKSNGWCCTNWPHCKHK